MRALVAQFAAFEALLLAASAVLKVAKWRYLQTVLPQFAGVPAPLAWWALGAAVAAELGAAVLLVLPAQRAAGAILAALLWAVYLGLILRAIAQGRRDVDCGCSFGQSQRPLDAFQVTRSAALLGIALLVAGASAMSGSVAVQGSQILGACALLALYGALDQVLALRPLRPGESL